jgi:hypothetical protein
MSLYDNLSFIQSEIEALQASLTRLESRLDALEFYLPPMPKADPLDSKEGGLGETNEVPKSDFGAVDLMKLWNTAAAPALPRVQLLTKTREAHIKARLASFPEKTFWADLISKVNASDLLTGQKGSWACSFDWILNPNNLAKILEGNYDDKFADRRR